MNVVFIEKTFQVFRLKGLSVLWCGAGSNRRHKDFQSFALPTELPHRSPPKPWRRRIACATVGKAAPFWLKSE
jgi:hypothetical protein